MQAVSQPCRQPCMQPGMHTYRERARCPHTDMQTETYLEIHTETEVHSQRQIDIDMYVQRYR